MRKLCLLLASSFSFVAAREFLYPVAANKKNDGVELYLLYQASVERLELLKFDPATGIATKVLLPTFTPGLCKVLPDGSGFSFVDKGRVVVKSFTKRSPKSVGFYAPIDDIAEITWIDAATFYFMAKEAQYYGIFQATVQGDLQLIAKGAHADYMYPQKVNDTLFFVKRVRSQNGDYVYSLHQTTYPSTPIPTLEGHSRDEQIAFLKREEQAQMEPLVADDQCTLVLDAQQSPIAFLHMVSESRGFYLEHPRTIGKLDSCVEFAYHQLDKKGQGWEQKKLFTFKLPTHFFLEDNEFRLYESLLPFLPRHSTTGIYFSDCYDRSLLKTGIYRYDEETGAISEVSPRLNTDMVGESFFSPLCIHGTTFYGGTLATEGSGEKRLPALWINDDGLLCVELPAVFEN